MAGLVRAAGSEIGQGYRELISARAEPLVGMTLATWKIASGESAVAGFADAETAVVVLSGEGTLECGGRMLEFERGGWVETAPTIVHVSAGGSIETRSAARSPVELIVVSVPNPRSFAPRFYAPSDIDIEHRGEGILDETCHRIVRLAFDDRNGPPESALVLGEVVNLAGRWSSYPPHHHPQPELYYYRFDPLNGYGHGELGEEVFKIRSGDLLAITGDRSHCQVSAPGYNMYYLWAVRHLEGNRYTGFTFEPEHAWTLEQRTEKRRIRSRP